MIHLGETVYGIEILTAPAELPLEVADLRAFIRIAVEDEDDFLSELIEAAAEQFENDTRRPILSTTYRQTFTRWADPLVLGRGGVTAIEALEALDPAGDVIGPVQFLADLKTPPARLHLAEPAEALDYSPVGQCDYVAGWAEPDDVPRDVRLAVRQLAAHWYLHREAYHGGPELRPVPRGWDVIVRRHALGLSGDWGQ